MLAVLFLKDDLSRLTLTQNSPRYAPLIATNNNATCMINEIRYQFETAPLANRFLNELKHWSKAEVKVKLFKSSHSVQVSYEYEAGSFDYTCSELDDLASQYGGTEI